MFVKGTRAAALETQVQLSCFQSNFLFILKLCKQMMATTQIALRVPITAKICFLLKSRVLIPHAFYFCFSHTIREGTT